MKFSAEIRHLVDRAVFRVLALVVLLTASMRLEPLSSTVLDPDLWWHLRDGNFIISQHIVPRHGLFTQYSNHPWVDYSWGSEVLMSLMHQRFGLMGLVALRSGIEVVLTTILFLLLRRGLGSFWQSWALAAVGMWAIHHCLGMQPMLFSILMFTIEIALIFEARRKNSISSLYWLPLVFFIWANLHIQFIYGLFVLMLLALVHVVKSLLPKSWAAELQTSDLPLSRVVGVAGVAALMTLIGPFSWRLYVVIFHYVRSSALYAIITELQALSFRLPEHFILALIVAAGFLALGWRRSRDPFNLALLVVCMLVGFRMTRDSWFCCLPALAIIADRGSPRVETENASRLSKLGFAAATASVTALVFLLVSWDSKTNQTSLARAVASEFPTSACTFIEAHTPRARIYNDMNWGGYLIWALPDNPVAIDNRPDLYGDGTLSRFYMVQKGIGNWSTDPDLTSAEVVLLNRQSPLAKLLAQDGRFHLVYEDALAVVFTPGQGVVNARQDSGLRPEKPSL